ncbi:MAG: CRISPR-associated endonuclease Cas2 [Lentisphaeria bacterium]|nr:CRISPR-associated endonuclease Cas2 [Lentisphaeria bacterium]
MHGRRRYLYCYDITDPKRLRLVHRLASGAGDRVQFSVYECQLTETEQVHLDESLRRTLNLQQDRLLIVDLGPVSTDQERRFRTMGIPWEPKDRAIIVV